MAIELLTNILGPNVALRKSGDYMQWRVDEDSALWQNLMPLADIQGLPGMDAAPTDVAVAGYVSTAGTSDTKTAVTNRIEDRTFVIDSNYASLEAAFAAVPVGGTLEIRGGYTRTVPFVIDKACTVRFARNASIVVTTEIAAVSITASNVTLENPKITGTGSTTAGTGQGISVIGTVGAPITNLSIVNPIITEFTKHAIWLEYVDLFSVLRPTITNISYGGIMLLSCSRGIIAGGLIDNLTQPAGFVNSYGIAMTRDTTKTVAAAPHTNTIVVIGVTVSIAPWEGIDTHSGRNIKIIGNTVLSARIGIAIVGSNNTSGTLTYAAQEITVANNTVDSRAYADRSYGIIMVGAGPHAAVGDVVEYATGDITNNTVIDHGKDISTSLFGAIFVYATRGLNISQNRLVQANGAGVRTGLNNYGLRIVDNVFEDVYSVSQWASMLYFPSAGLEVYIAGNRFVRGTKTATYVNTRGVVGDNANLASTTMEDGGGNNWHVATELPSSGITNMHKAAAYSLAPVLRANAITSPTADVAALKVAVDALRVALTNYGITR